MRARRGHRHRWRIRDDVKGCCHRSRAKPLFYAVPAFHTNAHFRTISIRTLREILQWLPRRPDEIAQNGYIGAISADASGIHGKSETLGEIEIHARVVQLRQAKPLGGQNTIDARRIHRTRRAVTPPRAPRQLVKLLPIAFVPSRHILFQGKSSAASGKTFASTLWMRARPIRFTCIPPAILPANTALALRPIPILHKPDGHLFSLPVVSNPLRDELFRNTVQGYRSGEHVLHPVPASKPIA
jgi:hypothetical protein